MPVIFVDCDDNHPGSLAIKAAIHVVEKIAAASTRVRKRLRRLERGWRCGVEWVSGPGAEGTAAYRLEVSCWATNDVATGRTAREAVLMYLVEYAVARNVASRKARMAATTPVHMCAVQCRLVPLER
eukprot:6184289-Pleurochrysis_carterae.AAC.1